MEGDKTLTWALLGPHGIHCPFVQGHQLQPMGKRGLQVAVKKCMKRWMRSTHRLSSLKKQ